MSSSRLKLAAAAAGCTLLLASCGGGYGSGGGSASASKPKSTPAAGSGATLKLDASEAGGGLSFSTKRLSAKAGTVTLDMTNPSGNSMEHAIALRGSGVNVSGKTVAPGADSTLTAKLKPGTYTFFCPVPGHEAAGMRGTLTVG